MAGNSYLLSEAVSLVRSGDRVAISGNLDMAPMSLIRELIRSRVRDLHLICSGSAAINADLLVGAGCVGTIELSHILIGEYGFAPQYRRAAEQGTVRTLDHTCPSLAAALQAGAMGIPFIPVQGLLGSDYLKVRDDFRTLANPYKPGEQIAVVPAIRPDICLFHGYEADTDGNVIASRLQNNLVLAQASKTSIVSVERIVKPDQLDRKKGVFIPAPFISAVVEAPGGAYPTASPGYYEADSAAIAIYMEAAGSPESFREYLRETVYDRPSAGEDRKGETK